LRRAEHSSKESYRLCIDEGTEKAVKAHKGCRAIEEEEEEEEEEESGRTKTAT
jgi:hypothetical protein